MLMLAFVFFMIDVLHKKRGIPDNASFPQLIAIGDPLTDSFFLLVVWVLPSLMMRRILRGKFVS